LTRAFQREILYHFVRVCTLNILESTCLETAFKDYTMSVSDVGKVERSSSQQTEVIS